MMPPIVNPAGALIVAGSMRPSGPSRPGMAESTTPTSELSTSGLSASHSDATEKPRKTPANTLNSVR